MATVFLAYDPHFKREVAVKILPRQFTHDPRFRARFEREAQTIAALEHYAIVPVYDFGEQDLQPYLVMRYMQGGTLSDRIQKGALSVAEATEIISRLCSALDEAHERDIIHRDLKPANILFDRHDKAYLSDFGIVKLANSTSTITGTGIIGTPAYMSPEQAKGVAELDRRSDLYTLGVILFEILTGRQPYTADTPQGYIFKHVSDPVPKIRQINPSLPSSCESMINKALAKNPVERFQTGADFYHALRDFDKRPAVNIKTEWLSVDKETNDHSGKKRRRQILIALFLFLTFVSALVGSYFLWGESWGIFQNQTSVNITAISTHTVVEPLLEEDSTPVPVALSGGESMNESPERTPTATLMHSPTPLSDIQPVNVTSDLNPSNPRFSDMTTNQIALSATIGEGVVTDLIYLKETDRFFVATTLGLYYLEHDSLSVESFFPLDQIVNDIAITNGEKVLAISLQNEVQLRKPGTFEYITSFTALNYEFSTVAISNDAQFAAAGTKEGTIFLWNIDTGSLIDDFEAHDGQINDLEFSPSGDILVSAGSDRKTILWNPTDQTVIDEIDLHSDVVNSVSFSSTGDLLATASDDKTVIIYDVEENVILDSLLHEDAVEEAMFGPFGNILVSASENLVWYWRKSGNRYQFSLVNNESAVNNVAFSNDNSTILTNSAQDGLKLINVNSGEIIKDSRLWGSSVRDVAFSRDTNHVAIGYEDGKVVIWNIQDNEPEFVLSDHTDAINVVDFSLDGEFFATGSDDQQVHVYDASNFELLNTMSNHVSTRGQISVVLAAVQDIAFLPFEPLILIADGRLMRTWDIETGEVINAYAEGSQIAMHLDGTTFYSIDGNKLRFWRTNGSELIFTRSLLNNDLTSLAISPDSTKLATTQSDNIVRVWDSIDRQVVLTLTGHKGFITDIQFSPNGTLIASSDSLGTIRFWRASDGQFLRELTAHNGGISSLNFSDDSASLVSGSEDGSVRIWNTTQLPTAPMPTEVWRRPLDGMEMVYLPSATFLMGATSTDFLASPDELPVHEVMVAELWMDKFEISQAQYVEFLNALAQAGNLPEDWNDYISETYVQPVFVENEEIDDLVIDKFFLDPTLANLPVTEVTWTGAQAYCQWVGGSLPTEAQWEYAVRGPDNYLYPWGNAVFGDFGPQLSCQHATFPGCTSQLSAVNAFPQGKSWAGAENLLGNASEWTLDWYGEAFYQESPLENPIGPDTGTTKVIRGGSWVTRFEYLRGTARFDADPNVPAADIGFRCVVVQP